MAGSNLALFGYKPSQQINLLVIDYYGMVRAEQADPRP
jgi:hypothetical protein